MTGRPKDDRGIALVVTLLAVALITVLVVEFSYGVYVGTESLSTWRDSQRVSRVAASGVTIAAKMTIDTLKTQGYSYPGVVEIPLSASFAGIEETMLIRIEDEGSKFNLNALVPPNENIREHDQQSPYRCFRRLLRVLGLDEKIADRIVDWIDSDAEARLTDSERGARNSALVSVDEVLLIPGISKSEHDALRPFVTVYGKRENISVNINGALKPVLRCLSEQVSDELAQRVIDFRKNNPFREKSDLAKVAGFERDVGIPSGAIAVKGEYVSVRSVASANGVKRIVEAVLRVDGGRVEYWKEY